MIPVQTRSAAGPAAIWWRSAGTGATLVRSKPRQASPIALGEGRMSVGVGHDSRSSRMLVASYCSGNDWPVRNPSRIRRATSWPTRRPRPVNSSDPPLGGVGKRICHDIAAICILALLFNPTPLGLISIHNQHGGRVGCQVCM